MRYQFSLKEIDSRKMNNVELFYYGMFWNFVHSGCLPFARKFLKFRLECKWQTFFGFIQLENSRNVRIV